MAWDQARSHRWVRRVAIAAGRPGTWCPLKNRCPQNVGRWLQFEIGDQLLRARSDLGLDVGDLSAIGVVRAAGSGRQKVIFRNALASAMCLCRRAHSDLLQWLHELGWLPCLVMVLLAVAPNVASTNVFLPRLPLLCFTFPSERAEIVVPMAFLYWSLLDETTFRRGRPSPWPFICWPRPWLWSPWVAFGTWLNTHLDKC